jgi:hypothetical protein
LEAACGKNFNFVPLMKKNLSIFFFILFLSIFSWEISSAQCSICTKTAQQLGEKPAKGLNTGIIYLALAPFAIGGYIFYRWMKNNREATSSQEIEN